MTDAQHKYCRNVLDLLFVVIPNISMIFYGYSFFCMNLLVGPVMVGLIELKPFASSVNLCANSSVAVGKIGLNVPLMRTKVS